LPTHDSQLADSSPPPGPLEVLEGGGVRVWAPAKLNLDLRVFPPRDDGFHPLDSAVVKITLLDCIEMRPRDDGEVRFMCEGADCGPAESNLVCRAIRRLGGGAVGRGLDVRLVKQVPPGRGLGGGSSDAAAALLACNHLWDLKLSADELSAVAADLGSDVPLFLGPPASRMTGRGEVLEPLAVHPFAAILCLSGLFCSTPQVYAAFDRLPAPSEYERDAGLLASQPPSAWRDGLRNDLLPAAEAVCPELGDLRWRLECQAQRPVCLTGSGSGLFILCDDQDEADVVLARLDDEMRSLCVVVRNCEW